MSPLTAVGEDKEVAEILNFFFLHLYLPEEGQRKAGLGGHPPR